MKPGVSGIQAATVTRSVLLVILLGLFQVSSLPQAPNSEFQRQLQLAQQRYQAGDLDGAIVSYLQAVKLNPQSGIAYSGLGSALLDKGNLKDAGAALEHAVALLDPPVTLPGTTQVAHGRDPLQFAVASNNLALVYYQQSRFDEALAVVERAVNTNSALSNCWNTRGMILEAKGKLDDAIASYRKANSISPKSSNMSHNLGEALQRKGQLDEAVLVLQQGLGFHPGDAELLTAYGNALSAKDRFTDAEAAYQKSLTARPDDAATLYGSGLLFVPRGNMRKPCGLPRALMNWLPPIRIPRWDWRASTRNWVATRKLPRWCKAWPPILPGIPFIFCSGLTR